jgi:hypothetical protein
MFPKLTVERRPKTGDREDFEVKVFQQEQLKGKFEMSVSGTALAIWGTVPVESAKALGETIVSVMGTAAPFPDNGYIFDSYNSEDTVEETQNKIRNLGDLPFIKDRTIRDEISRIYGGELLGKLDRLNGIFATNFGGIRFTNSLDCAFEFSEASYDLSSPPSDKPSLLYRICILSLIVDRFGVRLKSEGKDVSSLQALRNWLNEVLGGNRGDELTLVFQMVKNLRKQYPLHEHFDVTPEGELVVRKEVKQAKEYFNLTDEVTGDWKKIVSAFNGALDKIQEAISRSKE